LPSLGICRLSSVNFSHFNLLLWNRKANSSRECSVLCTPKTRREHRRLCRVKNMLAMYLKYHKAGLTPTTPVISTTISPVKMSIGCKSLTNLRSEMVFLQGKPVFYIFLPSTLPYWQIILRFCWQRATMAELTGWCFTFPSWDPPNFSIHWEPHRKRITTVSPTSWSSTDRNTPTVRLKSNPTTLTPVDCIACTTTNRHRGMELPDIVKDFSTVDLKGNEDKILRSDC
jgi:hypothetical protein